MEAWRALNYLSLKKDKTEDEKEIYRELKKMFGYKVSEKCEICHAEYYGSCLKCEVRFENKKLKRELR